MSAYYQNSVINAHGASIFMMSGGPAIIAMMPLGTVVLSLGPQCVKGNVGGSYRGIHAYLPAQKSGIECW